MAIDKIQSESINLALLTYEKKKKNLNLFKEKI